ncbi:gliding motility-associated C-terminal domain-containing protein [Pedobacter sp. BS3]|uniref:Ig-like domain-containing protein n=1 Tax=Pedobacter sp. BS3 TaxID=2567937 RepID=UPI001658EFC2|nr:gliding motility-associated C-terminal domain-containing protein [Pedobacter sp. BS3]
MCLTSYAQQPVQRVYANSAQKSADDYLLIIKAGYVENEGQAVDGNPQNAATLNSTVVNVLGANIGGQAALRLRFTGADKPSAGVPLTIKLGIGGNVLSALDGLTVQAVNGAATSNNGNGNEVGPVYKASSLVNLLGGENQVEFTITPTVAYDGVKIKLGGTGDILSAGVLASAKVYHAYFTKPATGVVCNAPIDLLYGSTGNLAGSLNPVENPGNAIDGNENSSALLRANVSALNKTFLTAVYPSLSKAGDSIRLVIQPQGTGLLDATLLASNFTVRTYKDNTDNGALALQSSFLHLSLLGGSGNKYVLTYPVNKAFNRIQLSLGEGLVNALSGLYVYEMGRIAPSPVIQAPGLSGNTLTVCQGIALDISITNPETDAVYKWFDAETGGSEVTNGVSANGTLFSPTGLAAGSHDFYVAVYRNGCTDPASGRTKVTIIVTPAATAAQITAPGTSVCPGQTATLAAPSLTTAGSISNPVFTWYFDQAKTLPVTSGTTDGVTYTLNADGSLNISGLTATKSYYVSVQGTGVCENVAGDLKEVTVTVNTTPQPALNLSGTQIIGTGGTLQLEATSAGATAFQWYKDGNPLSGETAATLTRSNVTSADAGVYTVIAFGAGGCASVVSVPVTIQVAGFGSTKTVSGLNADGKIEAGSTLTYTITVSNTGSTTLTGITISDQIPAGTTYVAASADNGGALTGSTLNWTIDVPAGDNKAVSFQVKVTDDLTGLAAIGNTATVTNPADPGNPQNPEVPPTPTDQQRTFTSTKTVSGLDANGKITAGSELTYTITIQNTGNVALTGITVADPIPANTTYVDASADNGGTLTAGVLNWTVDVPVGQSRSVSFRVTVPGDLTGIPSIGNKATITDPADPGNPQNPEVPPTPTDQQRTFTSTKTVSGLNTDGKIDAGSELTYTITIQNTGNVSLAGLSVTDPIPANTIYVDGSADNGGVLTAGVLSWTVDVPVGQSKSVSFRVTVPDDLTGIPSIGNKATITDPADPGNPQNPEVPPTPTDQQRKFTSTKTVSGLNTDGKIEAGSELTYTITIQNTGNVALTGIAISDQIPAGTTYIDASANNGGTLTAGVLNWTVDVPVGQSLPVSFRVKVADDLTNFASIGNKATVTDPDDPGHPQNPEVPPTPTDQRSDFTVTSSVASTNPDGKAHPDDVLTYTITVTNAGNMQLSNISVTDPVPAKTTFASAENGGSLDAGTNTVNFTIPSLAVGASATVSFKVTVQHNLGGTSVISNTATITYNTIQKTTQADIAVGCDVTTVADLMVNGGPGGDICVSSTSVQISTSAAGLTNPIFYLYNGTNLVSSNTTGVFTVATIAGNTYTYSVGVSADGYCETPEANRKTITFKVNTIPGTPAVTAASVDVCSGSQATLSVANPQSDVTYKWYTVASGGTPAGAGASFTTTPVTANTSFFVEAVSASSCVSGRTEVKVNVLAPPVAPASVTVADIPLCGGSKATLSVDNPGASLTYRWYDVSSGGTALGEGPVFTSEALQATTTFYVESVSKTGGCISVARTAATVTVLPELAAPVVTVQSVTAGSVTFAWNAIAGATAYEISIDNGTTWQQPDSGPAGLSHTVSGLKPDVDVTILVRAKGQLACQTSPASAPVKGTSANPLGNQIFVPNTFTPNNDGKNDILYVYGNTIAKQRFRIYNQWGQLIYESLSQADGWDGTFKGQVQPTGVYVYYVEVTFKDGTSGLKKGTVTLIR